MQQQHMRASEGQMGTYPWDVIKAPPTQPRTLDAFNLWVAINTLRRLAWLCMAQSHHCSATYQQYHCSAQTTKHAHKNNHQRTMHKCDSLHCDSLHHERSVFSTKHYSSSSGDRTSPVKKITRSHTRPCLMSLFCLFFVMGSSLSC